MAARVVLLALDGVPPQILFGSELEQAMPNVTRLRRQGWWGPLQSVIPAITVPAWSCAMTGRDPGELGVYGFRNRTSWASRQFSLVSSNDIATDALWDAASRAGFTSTVIGLPPGYPPRRIRGEWVGCMLTPDRDREYTWPDVLRHEIQAVVGEYVFDIDDFRRQDRAGLLAAIRTMTERRWRLARHLLATRASDLFVLHEIGPDRIHHAFWQDHDPAHRRHDPRSPFVHAITDYYAALDREIGDLVELAPDATVVIASDHGCQPMAGGIRINQWLLEQGYLRLRSRPSHPVPFSVAEVDWARTVAWAGGGYYARVWLNLVGREISGIVHPERAAAFLDEIASGLSTIPDASGNPLRTRVHRPKDLYHEIRGVPPDLIVYFGDMSWRALASVGGSGWHTFENDTGPDSANHAEDGVCVIAPLRGRVALSGSASLIDLAATLADLLALPTQVFPGRPLLA